MKRNSWFVVKIEKNFNMESFNWVFPGGKKKFDRNVQKAIEISPDKVFSSKIYVDMHGAYTDKRTYWRSDWEKADPIEGGSVWTDYRREALKFQSKVEAEKFAYERTQKFPSYIGLIYVERLRWNPEPKGPISYSGPRVSMALAV